MKLLIHGRTLEGKRTGVGRYLANILRIWTEEYKDNTYDIFFRDEIPNDDFISSPNVNSHLVKNSKILDYGPIWENIYLPSKLSKFKDYYIYFTPEYILPVRSLKAARKKIVTIFDISYIAHPEWFPKKQLLTLKPLTSPTLKRADIILTSSASTKNDILKYYDINGDKIHVTHLGVDKKFEDINGIKDSHYVENVKIKYDLRGKVVLFVGLVMNRRNIPVIMEAISNLKKKNGEDITFVILGHNHTYPYIDILETARKFDIENSIKWIKYTSDEEVFSLYKAADVFMCASLYEGFNITPLEALYLETPIICSNLSSLPEVVGDAAYMIEDPTDPVEMTKALGDVLSNDELRNDLKAKGLIQAQKFSWERCAKETMDIFKNTMND